MPEQTNQPSQTSPEENEHAEVFSISQDRDGLWHLTRRDFLHLSLAAGGTLLLKGICPRFGANSASAQPVQAGMMPLPKVYVHTKPSIDSNIVDTLQQNDLVLLKGDHPDLGWVEVATRTGKRGWLNRNFVDFTRAVTLSSPDFDLSKTQIPTPTQTPTPTVHPIQSGGEATQNRDMAGTADTYYLYLPIVVNGSAPTTPNPPTSTPCASYVSPCPGNSFCPPVDNCPLYVAPCPGNRFCPPVESCLLYVAPCPGNRFCPPVESCLLYVAPCPGNRFCPPVESCLLYNSCTCDTNPCSCNIAPCSCNAFPCVCDFNPCSCNSYPTFCTCNFNPCFVT